jgi:hypothetical protein
MINDGDRVKFSMPGVEYTGVATATDNPNEFLITLDQDTTDHPVMTADRLTKI